MPLKIYLAGPEVFLPNAREMLDRKAAMARAAGFEPLSPGDLKVEKRGTVRDYAYAISEVNERMMLSAGAMIANLTPWRGISADAGTVYELGFMCALDKIVYAYTNIAKNCFERTADYYGGRWQPDASGTPRGPDGLAMENYELFDNLMLPGGAERRGGKVVVGNAPPEAIYTDTTAFAECLRLIAGQRR